MIQYVFFAYPFFTEAQIRH